MGAKPILQYSKDAIDDSFGKCSSKVIILGGVEIKMVDFGGV